MNNHTQYAIVFAGGIRHGFDSANVKSALAETLRLSSVCVERLFNPGRHVLKCTESLRDAQKLAVVIARAGAMVSIEKQQAKDECPAPKQDIATGYLDDANQTFRTLDNPLMFKGWLHTAAIVETVLTLLHAGLLFGAGLFVLHSVLLVDWTESYAVAAAYVPLLKLLTLMGAGILLVLFGKPLLAWFNRGEADIPLSAEEQADIHRYVENICLELNLPQPHTLRLDLGTSIRMGYRQGFAALLHGETELNIGAPLLYGMNNRTLAAQIAAALSEFHANGATWSAYLIHRQHQWHHQATFGQDALDRLLERIREQGQIPNPLSIKVKKVFNLTRRLALARLKINRLLCQRPIQQLTREADALAAAIDGSEATRSCLEHQRQLDFSRRNLIADIKAQWLKQQIAPDDFAQATIRRADEYGDSVTRELTHLEYREHAHNYSLRPSIAQRIQRLEASEAEPHFSNTTPATQLFHQLDKLSRHATRLFYRRTLGLPVIGHQLQHPGSDENKLLEHYFNHLYTDFVPLLDGYEVTPMAEYRSLVANWFTAMHNIGSRRHQNPTARTAYQDAQNNLYSAATGELLLRADLQSIMGEGHTRQSLESLQTSCRESEAIISVRLEELREQLSPYLKRLSSSLSLSFQPQVLLDEHDRQLQNEIRHISGILKRLEGIYPQLQELHLNTIMLDMLLSYHRDRPLPLQQDRIDELHNDIQKQTTAIGVALKSIPYPFNSEIKTAMQYVMREASTANSVDGVLDRGIEMVRQSALMQRRLVSRLLTVALYLEQAMGLVDTTRHHA